MNVSIPDLEREIEQALHAGKTPMPTITPLMPTKLTARIDDIGRMSAEAVLTQYEAAARSVEEMGVAVKERIAALEAALKECDKDLKIIAEAAAMIREKGKLVQAQIEEASALSTDIRAACTDFKAKVGA